MYKKFRSIELEALQQKAYIIHLPKSFTIRTVIEALHLPLYKPLVCNAMRTVRS